MLAFVLLEPDEGKLSRPVPRGLGAGNRVWLPCDPITAACSLTRFNLVPTMAATH
jgi:hypothetical protein